MSLIALSCSDAKGALAYARKAVETDPKFSLGYDALSSAYKALGMKEETVKAGEELVRLRENDKTAHFSLLISLHELGDEERLRIAAERAIPIYERYIRLNPDDYHALVSLASIYAMSGNLFSALAAADELSSIETLDGFALYNLACLYLNCNTPDRGMEHLRRAVAKGFRDIEAFRRDPDLNPLRGTPEFEELIKELESSSAKD
jgi:tetratricopeptide (TPR) repeat protein